MFFPALPDRTLATLGVALFLGACGGSGSGGGGSGGGGFGSLRCDTINTGGAQTTSGIDPGCANCAVTDAANASDDDANTFATLDATNAPEGQGVTIRSTAQSGVVYPAGKHVSAFVTYAENASGVNAAAVITLRTYASGVLQERQSTGASNCVSNCGLTRDDLGVSGDGTLPHSFVWFQATAPFDAVEIHYSAPGVHTAPAPLQVYGLCSDGSTGA